VPTVQERLVKCFAAVFPRLSPEEIPRANINSVSAWDSLAALTLASVIEEEFSVAIDPRDREDLVSFDLLLDHLTRDKGVS
jgi:acyl carrier protein